MQSSLSGDSSTRWIALVEQITSGDARGVEELYLVLSEHARARLGQAVHRSSVEDALHEVLVIVLEAIRTGGLRDPRRLMGFVKTVTQRRAVAHIRYAIFRRRRFVTAEGPEPRAPWRDSPESRLAARERELRAEKLLRRLSVRDREILERFYLREQPAEQICGEMQLTETQFCLFKSRAIARCCAIASITPPSRSGSRSA
jgi:DNA-directed RNA polymerase specialized sigma24 family protein